MYELLVWIPPTPLKRGPWQKILKVTKDRRDPPFIKGATTDSLYVKELGDLYGELTVLH